MLLTVAHAYSDKVMVLLGNNWEIRKVSQWVGASCCVGQTLSCSHMHTDIQYCSLNLREVEKQPAAYNWHDHQHAAVAVGTILWKSGFFPPFSSLNIMTGCATEEVLFIII